MLSLRAPSQQQDRDVPAADQKKRSDGAEQQIERRSQRLRIHFNNAAQIHAEAVRIPLWRLFRELLDNWLQLGVGLFDSRPGANFDRGPNVKVRMEGNLERQ